MAELDARKGTITTAKEQLETVYALCLGKEDKQIHEEKGLTERINSGLASLEAAFTNGTLKSIKQSVDTRLH